MIKPLHKMSERQVRREMQAAGFKHVKTVRTLPLQHFDDLRGRAVAVIAALRGMTN